MANALPTPPAPHATVADKAAHGFIRRGHLNDVFNALREERPGRASYINTARAKCSKTTDNAPSNAAKSAKLETPETGARWDREDAGDVVVGERSRPQELGGPATWSPRSGHGCFAPGPAPREGSGETARPSRSLGWETRAMKTPNKNAAPYILEYHEISDRHKHDLPTMNRLVKEQLLHGEAPAGEASHLLRSGDGLGIRAQGRERLHAV